MMPERIGTIGSTQGVKASSRPKPRKLASTSQVLPLEQRGDVEVARRERHARGPAPRGANEARRSVAVRLHRHVAHADVGAALRGHNELQRIARARLDRHADAHFLAVGLRVAEELVLLAHARRELGLAEARILGGELEALAVQVIAVGDGELHFHRIARRARAPRSGTPFRARAGPAATPQALAAPRARATGRRNRVIGERWFPRPPNPGRRAGRARLGPPRSREVRRDAPPRIAASRAA